MTALRGLYPIVDVGVLERADLPIVPFTEAVLAERPAVLQLRAKNVSDAAILKLASQLAPLCREAGTTFVLNDRPDLAVAANVEWVHVGQGDMPANDLRARFPALSFGVSTHSLEQLHLALRSKPSYVAFGPVFDTPTKENPDPTVGLAALARAKDAASEAGLPLVAIGGIREANVPAVAGVSDLWAVISGIVPPASFGVLDARLAEVRRLMKAYR